MQVAVTGATGFIGRHVAAEAKQRGHHVRALHRSPPARAQPGLDLRQIDLRHPAGLAEALHGCDVVIHCAASLGGDPITQQADTVDGTRNLLHAMQAADVTRIVLISSFAVYDYLALPDDALLDESAPVERNVQRRAPYIQAKLSQESLVRDAANMNWIILRPGLVFGPARTWFHQLGAVLPAHTWLSLAPDSMLPLTHVQNCAQAIVLAAERDDVAHQVLNVVDDVTPPRREYVHALAGHQSHKPRVLELSWSVLSRLAGLADSVNERALRARAPLPDLLRPPSLAERCKPLRYTNARAREILGWQPRVQWLTGLQDALTAQASA